MTGADDAMPVRYRVSHVTAYRYAEPVDLACHILHMTPRVCSRQRVPEAVIVSVPEPSWRAEATDHYGNTVTYLTVDTPHDAFSVELAATVAVTAPAAVAAEATPPWEAVRAMLAGPFPEAAAAAEFTFASPHAAPAADITAYAGASFPPGRPILAAARDLTGRIRRDFAYDPKATGIATPLGEVLARRRGVCQDFAHLQIAALRGLGLAARYVSGYIRTRRQTRGADASHAWVAVWCGPAGWVELDPTNDLVVADEHVVLAWGRDYGDVSPLRGVLLGGGRHSLEVAVTLTPLDEPPGAGNRPAARDEGRPQCSSC